MCAYVKVTAEHATLPTLQHSTLFTHTQMHTQTDTQADQHALNAGAHVSTLSLSCVPTTPVLRLMQDYHKLSGRMKCWWSAGGGKSVRCAEYRTATSTALERPRHVRQKGSRSINNRQPAWVRKQGTQTYLEPSTQPHLARQTPMEVTESQQQQQHTTAAGHDLQLLRGKHNHLVLY